MKIPLSEIPFLIRRHAGNPEKVHLLLHVEFYTTQSFKRTNTNSSQKTMCQDRLAMARSNGDEPQHPENNDTLNMSRHRRNSVSENEDGEFMKEEDAAILERGIRDSCSSGETPLLSHHVSNKDIPVMDLNDLLEESSSSLHHSAADKASSDNVIEEADWP